MNDIQSVILKLSFLMCSFLSTKLRITVLEAKLNCNVSVNRIDILKDFNSVDRICQCVYSLRILAFYCKTPLKRMEVVILKKIYSQRVIF